MNISDFKSVLRQLRLFDEPLGNLGHVRTLLGDAAEGYVARSVRGRRHKTDSTKDYCPDVSVVIDRQPVYIESKCSGRNGDLFIYKGRYAKDVMFSRCQTLVYAVVQHNLRTSQYSTVDTLTSAFLAAIQGVYLIPFPVVDEIVRGTKLEALNSGFSYGPQGSKVYGSGYRMRLSNFSNWRLVPKDRPDYRSVLKRRVREQRAKQQQLNEGR